MAAFKRMTDLSYGPDEKRGYDAPASLLSGPDYPPGLSLTLDERTLEKLDLEACCEVGDLIHLTTMAKVKSISKSEDCCTICLQIIAMSVEDESTEDDDEAEG